jgi:hypothetical protein
MAELVWQWKDTLDHSTHGRGRILHTGPGWADVLFNGRPDVIAIQRHDKGIIGIYPVGTPLPPAPPPPRITAFQGFFPPPPPPVLQVCWHCGESLPLMGQRCPECHHCLCPQCGACLYPCYQHSGVGLWCLHDEICLAQVIRWGADDHRKRHWGKLQRVGLTPTSRSYAEFYAGHVRSALAIP